MQAQFNEMVATLKKPGADILASWTPEKASASHMLVGIMDEYFEFIEAGGAGLNLQVASHIIFYECPTSPKDATQAVARCDRTGQQNIVNVYFMRVLGTLSDKNFRKLLEAEEDVNKVVQDDLDLLHKQLRK